MAKQRQARPSKASSDYSTSVEQETDLGPMGAMLGYYEKIRRQRLGASGELARPPYKVIEGRKHDNNLDTNRLYKAPLVPTKDIGP